METTLASLSRWGDPSPGVQSRWAAFSVPVLEAITSAQPGAGPSWGLVRSVTPCVRLAECAAVAEASG